MSNQIGWYTMKNQFGNRGEYFDDLRNINCFGKKYVRTSNLQGQLEILHKIKWNRLKNVVAIYDYYQNSQNELYVFMEKCNSDLSTYHQNLKEREKNLYFYQNLISQVSKGYLELKSLQIIHRDIKPDNILVIEQNGFITYKICDFDISKKLEDVQRMKTDQQQGTIRYSAPEISESKYSYAADMFSFGLTIFQLLAGDNNLNQSQTKLNSFYNQLKNKSFEQILQEQKIKLQIDALYSSQIIKILNRMIVFQPENRISWENLYLEFANNSIQIQKQQLSKQCKTEQSQEGIQQINFRQLAQPDLFQRPKMDFNNNANQVNNLLIPAKNQNFNNFANNQKNNDQINNITPKDRYQNFDSNRNQLILPFQQPVNYFSARNGEQNKTNKQLQQKQGEFQNFKQCMHQQNQSIPINLCNNLGNNNRFNAKPQYLDQSNQQRPQISQGFIRFEQQVNQLQRGYPPDLTKQYRSVSLYGNIKRT